MVRKYSFSLLFRNIFECKPRTIMATNIVCKSSGLSQARGLGVFSPPVFGQTVNPISTRGADCAHHSTTSPPPDFQTLRRPCYYVLQQKCHSLKIPQGQPYKFLLSITLLTQVFTFIVICFKDIFQKNRDILRVFTIKLFTTDISRFANSEILQIADSIKT